MSPTTVLTSPLPGDKIGRIGVDCKMRSTLLGPVFQVHIKKGVFGGWVGGGCFTCLIFEEVIVELQRIYTVIISE